MASPILSVRDHPHSDESLMGFTLRLSEANHFSGMQWLAEVFHVGRIHHLSARHAPLIAWLFGSEPQKFHALHATLHKKNGRSILFAFGHLITRPYLMRLRRPQVCIECLAEFGYVKCLWDFVLVTCCPIHRTMLKESCDACNMNLSWNRPGISKCRCGHDIRLGSSEGASNACIAYSQWMALRLVDVSNSRSAIISESPVLSLFSDMSVDGASRIIWATGINASALETIAAGKSKKDLSTLQASRCVERSIQRLHEIQKTQNFANIRPAFVSSSLLSILEDGLCDSDIRFARGLLLEGKLRENPKASLLHLNPLSQIKLF
ncbi:TniQ family protein [Undibacterium terreum]|uniref:TniQ family protein n=1 Tax=Undibacterium terreum TaxID=1224302 RepID=UPI00227BA0A8|nr:TniQ family protein [Undibacterium terreum]